MVLAGPTASGKTGLALKLAERLPLRLISADSMQVYRGMDIGTAKPMGADRSRFALIDVADPGEGYSAGRFAREAAEACETAWKEGTVPCLVGGSGLYLRALLRGMAEVPPIPAALRAEIEAMDPGARAAELSRLDPETAAAIEMKNPRRVSRALEVLKSTGKGLLAWQKAGHAGALRYGALLGFCLERDPADLAKRVRQRNLDALERGWAAEAAALAARHGAEAMKATGAIGYAELLEMAPEKAMPLIETRTLQYARRQRTWFRKEPDLRPEADFAKIEQAATSFTKG
jgi:tRNA dimethylallyltransferase